MSSRSITKSGSALVDTGDHTSDELPTTEVAGRVEQAAETEHETLTVEVDDTPVAIDSESTEAQPVPDLDTDSADTYATDSLAWQPEQIVEAAAAVRE